MLDGATKQRVKELCDLIAKEQDHKRFSMLISELNQLLDGFNSAGGEPRPASAGEPRPASAPLPDENPS